MGRENDKTRGIAKAAVIVAAIRSGGTFLSHCLSNHGAIFCDRGEPLPHRSVWTETLRSDRRALLAALFDQTGYQVSMCKLTYTQALHRDIWPWLVKRQPLVIWLTRENLIRQAVSTLINKQARDGAIKRPQHTFETTRPVKIELDPNQILNTARGLQARDDRARGCLHLMANVLPVTYAEITGGEVAATAECIPEETEARLCDFLGVHREPLRCDLQRVNPYPLREMLSNWRAVRQAIKRSEFAEMLADV